VPDADHSLKAVHKQKGVELLTTDKQHLAKMENVRQLPCARHDCPDVPDFSRRCPAAAIQEVTAKHWPY